MSETQGNTQKERLNKVRRHPDRERSLQRPFTFSRARGTISGHASESKYSARPVGVSTSSAQKSAGSEPVVAHDFTRVPANTTRGLGGLRPGAPKEDPPRVGIGGAVNGVSIDRGRTLRRQGDEPAEIKIETHNTVPPVWFPHGAFRWHVGFATTGTNGWIVQKVTNTYNGVDSIGGPINNATVGVTPEYYEAWKVGADSTVSPSDGATNDMFERPDLSVDPAFMDPGTKGSFSMTGKVYWTASDPSASGLAEEAIPDAGILLSGLSAPDGIGAPLLSRLAEGNWDSTGDPPTHEGNAA